MEANANVPQSIQSAVYVATIIRFHEQPFSLRRLFWSEETDYSDRQRGSAFHPRGPRRPADLPDSAHKRAVHVKGKSCQARSEILRKNIRLNSRVVRNFCSCLTFHLPSNFLSLVCSSRLSNNNEQLKRLQYHSNLNDGHVHVSLETFKRHWWVNAQYGNIPYTHCQTCHGGVWRTRVKNATIILAPEISWYQGFHLPHD